MTKRVRDDPNEYLGGDLTSDISFVENKDGDDERRPATKKERNEKRRQANKEWKSSDRLVDSGKDPNPRHTLYYKQQLPCLNTEWNEFQLSLCTPLPVTFRFGGSCPKIVEASIKKRVADEFRTMRGRYVELNGTVLSDDIVKPISWCKSWQIAADSGTLARSEALNPLYELLSREVTLGNVVRQELASMIPVLLLDVHHDHTVLDVCAAPGSKTEQILAAMQQHGESNGLGSVCSGMVVANDADPKRILTLKKR
jgi:16S rRNA C967 or C1407 C5-methylase (RsmB/RsmF family)